MIFAFADELIIAMCRNVRILSMKCGRRIPAVERGCAPVRSPTSLALAVHARTRPHSADFRFRLLSQLRPG